MNAHDADISHFLTAAIFEAMERGVPGAADRLAKLAQDPAQLLAIIGSGGSDGAQLSWVRAPLSDHHSRNRWLDTRTGHVRYFAGDLEHAGVHAPAVQPLTPAVQTPNTVVVPPMPEERPDLIPDAIAQARPWFTPAGILHMAKTLLHGATHPLETANAARKRAGEKLKAVYENYGLKGTMAIGSAYIGYYAAALAVQPALLMVPLPLTATLLTTAEVIRRLREKLLGGAGKTHLATKGYLDPDTAVRLVRDYLTAIAEEHEEPVPEIDEALLRAVLAELLEQHDTDDDENAAVLDQLEQWADAGSPEAQDMLGAGDDADLWQEYEAGHGVDEQDGFGWQLSLYRLSLIRLGWTSEDEQKHPRDHGKFSHTKGTGSDAEPEEDASGPQQTVAASDLDALIEHVRTGAVGEYADAIVEAAKRQAAMSEDEWETHVGTAEKKAKKAKSINQDVLESAAAALIRSFQTQQFKGQQQQRRQKTIDATAEVRRGVFDPAGATSDKQKQYADAYHKLRRFLQAGGSLLRYNPVHQRQERETERSYQFDDATGEVRLPESLRSRKMVTLDPSAVIDLANTLPDDGEEEQSRLNTLREWARRGSVHAQQELIRLGWTQSGKTAGGKTRWKGYAEDQGKTRYQESEPGTHTKRRQAKLAHAQTWHEGDHDALHQRLQDTHGDVSEISMPTDEATANRVHAALKRHHGTPEKLMKRLREKAGEYAWILQEQSGASPIQREKARRMLAGLAGMVRREMGKEEPREEEKPEEAKEDEKVPDAKPLPMPSAAQVTKGKEPEGADALPPLVRRRLEWAIGKYQEHAQAVEQGKSADRMFKGEGRYEEEVRAKYGPEHFKEADAFLEEFKRLAPKNGVDAERVLKELGMPEQPTAKEEPKKEEKKPEVEFKQTKKSLHSQLVEKAASQGKTLAPEHFPDGRLGYRVDGELRTPGETEKYLDNKGGESPLVQADTVSGAKHVGKLVEVDNGTAIIEKPDGTTHATPVEALKPPTTGQRSPHLALADALAEKLRAGETIDAKGLFEAANDAHGGTRAEGKYGPSDAYDSLEAGFNKALDGETDPTLDLAGAVQQAESLAERVQQLPTQTNRSGNKDTFQQFSTPPHYAYAVNWIANLGASDTVLEPSAGTGCLAVHAKNAGAQVVANELDPRRAEFLKDQFGAANVHEENAEQIGAILPSRGVRPTAVVMNPPFSQTAGRMGDKKELLAGAKHIREALDTLAPGGRLVAIVGRGMTPDSPTYREWFRTVKGQFSLRANVGVSGGEYKKYGTQFDTRVLVFDKTGAHQGETVSGDVADVPSLMQKLEGVRNDRPQVAGRSPGQPGSADAAGPGGLVQQPAGDTATAAADGLAEQPATGGVPGGAQLPGRAEGAGAVPGAGSQPGGSGGAADGGLRAAPAGSPGSETGVAGAPGAPGQPAPGDAAAGKPRGSRKGAGGKHAQQPAAPLPRLRPAKPVVLKAVSPGGHEAAGTGDTPPALPDPHFTGTLTDSLGREYHFVDGKRVKSPADAASGAASQADLGPSLYESYRPKLLRVEGGQQHATPLVESAAMAAVNPPVPSYTPTLSPDLVEKGILSEAQLESLVYAGQAHQAFLPGGAASLQNGEILIGADGKTQHVLTKTEEGRWIVSGTDLSFGSVEQAQQHLATAGFRLLQGGPVPPTAAYRRGYFVGDGTGVGKGRQIAGIISDNWSQGRKKHVWISQKQNLFEDAHRDWSALGQNKADLIHFDKIRGKQETPGEGVAFVTYDTLKGNSKNAAGDKELNIEQLARWLGPDFDGVIAFDEAHGMANGMATKGGRGEVAASQKALAGIRLQQMFPKARVVYVSATGATEVSNLAYAERLGLWGRGTAFADKAEFFNQMNAGGVAAMEAVAQSLKAMGGYTARSLSFDDGTPEGKVTYDRITHKLSEDQRAQYDAAADSWQVVLQNIDKALELTGGNKDKNARSAAKSQFWGAQQRFFNQVMTAMQTPSVIAAMERDIAEGRAPVVQVVNTGEAALKRALADRDEEEGVEDMDLSPKQVLMQYLEKSFPVNRMEEYLDKDGNKLMRPVQDSQGNPVSDPAAVAIRDELLTLVNMMRIPESPLDMIVRHFGHENVAEATGRTQRIVHKEQDDGSRKPTVERRDPTAANSADAAAFQEGKKKLLIFSDAGGTGRSYHADRNAQNQKHRVHYMLQPGWRADNAVQGLGRTHRTNQVSAPSYRLVEIDDLKAQKRFISTIARRLDQLGALTKGQRQAGSGGMFSAADNLESPQASEAMTRFFRDLRDGNVEGLVHDEVITQLGLKKPEEDVSGRSRRRQQEQPPEPDSMGQFLNRLLSLRVDMQGKVFEAFEKRLQDTVEQAVREGTLDTGVENFPAQHISRSSEKPIYKDQSTGAEVRHVVTKVRQKADKTSWEDVQGRKDKPVAYVQNKQSGSVWAAFKVADKTDPLTGRVIQQYKLVGPTGVHFRPAADIDDHYYGKFGHLDEGKAQSLWEEAHKEAPEFTESEEHFLTGALLPIWNRIPGEKPKIYRLKTDDGQSVVGRHVPRKHVETLMKNLGIQHQGARHDATQVHGQLQAGRATVTLANGWQVKPVRFQGERAIELVGGKNYGQEIGIGAMRELQADGVVVTRANYTNRYFIPTGPEGAAVLERITRSRPIADVEDADGGGRSIPAPVSSSPPPVSPPPSPVAQPETVSASPVATPAPAPAPPAAPAPAPQPQPVKTRQVSTSKGQRHVYSFSPASKFWDLRKAGKLPQHTSVRKNDRTGQWEASIWGASPEEVNRNAEELRGLGIRLSTLIHVEDIEPVVQGWPRSLLERWARSGSPEARALLANG